MKRLMLVLLSLAIISGCTSEPNQPQQKPQPQAPELLTGRSTFQQLYVAAHGWAFDARPYLLQSQVIGDIKGKDGKSALWRAAFASELQRSSKPYMWSGIDSPEVFGRRIATRLPQRREAVVERGACWIEHRVGEKSDSADFVP